MSAIEEGVATKRMIERIKELEEQESKLQDQINTERLNVSTTILSKEEIVYWLSLFKNGDIHSREFCKKLTDLFVNKVVVLPNKVDIYYNYMDQSHQELMLFSNEKVMDIDTLISTKVSEYQVLKISKQGFCLEVLL